VVSVNKEFGCKVDAVSIDQHINENPVAVVERTVKKGHR
jgi:hypothetical protein